MSLVFNTNLQRNGIDWRIISSLNAYRSAINANVGKTTVNSGVLVNSPFADTSSVNSVLLSNGNVLCCGIEGIYEFNPVDISFTYKSNVSGIDKLVLLNDGNILCLKSPNQLAILNPNNGLYIKQTHPDIIIENKNVNQSINIEVGSQLITVNNVNGGTYDIIPGVILRLTGSLWSFDGLVTSVSPSTSSFTISKTSTNGFGTQNGWTISKIGQNSSPLSDFGYGVLNFQKIDSISASLFAGRDLVYVLADSSTGLTGTDRDVTIDPINWRIYFRQKSINLLNKSSSIYVDGFIRTPINIAVKIINTRSLNRDIFAEYENSGFLKLYYPPSITLTNTATSNNVNIFCMLPQIDSQVNNQAQGIILLWIKNGLMQKWRTSDNTILTESITGSAPDEYTQPVILLDGRILLKPLSGASNPSSFLIYGGGGGFNPNVTLSPFFNKWN